MAISKIKNIISVNEISGVTPSNTYCDTGSEIRVLRTGNTITVSFNLPIKANAANTNILVTGLPVPASNRRVIFLGGYGPETRRLAIDTNGRLTCYYMDINATSPIKDLYGCVTYATEG